MIVEFLHPDGSLRQVRLLAGRCRDRIPADPAGSPDSKPAAPDLAG
jgi:hypothetical protein